MDRVQRTGVKQEQESSINFV